MCANMKTNNIKENKREFLLKQTNIQKIIFDIFVIQENSNQSVKFSDFFIKNIITYFLSIILIKYFLSKLNNNQ